MDQRKRSRGDSFDSYDRDRDRDFRRRRDRDYNDRERDYGGEREHGQRDRGRDGDRYYDRDRDWGRDRDRGRDRGREDHYDRYRRSGRRDYYDDEGRGRERGRGRYSDRYDAGRKPSNVVMLRGLEAHCTERSVMDAVNAEQRFDVNKLRIVRDKMSGVCKGFAFLEFFTVEGATSFMRAFGGSALHPLPDEGGSGRGSGGADKQLFVSDRALTLEFASGLGDGSGGDRRRQQAEDWICSVCHKMNFARRKECFSCGHPMGPDSKLVSELKKPSRSREIGCKVLHVFNLPQDCTEDMVHKTFSEFGDVQTVRLTPTGGRAYVEYLTVDQAQQAYRICVSQQNILRVGESFVHVEMADLGQGSDPGAASSSSYYAQSVASTALQSAGWVSQHGDLSGQQQQSHAPKVPKKLAEWPTPFDQGGVTYRVEPTSGLYYEDKSGFYYNYTTKTYYSTVTKKYFKHEGGKFEECEGPKPEEGEISESGGTQGTQAAKGTSSASTSTKSGAVSFALDSINLKLGGESDEQSKQPKAAGNSPKSRKSSKGTKLVPLPKEAKKIDSNLKQWSKVKQYKPICTLCRRKFASEEKLERHVKLSELHKKNLALQKGNTPAGLGKPISTAAPKSVAAATKAATAAGYRDRAGDRRKLFGQEKGAEDTREHTVDKAEHPIYLTEEENTGTKLLKAMGWKEGQGLGKDGKGMVAPLRVDGTAQDPGAST